MIFFVLTEMLEKKLRNRTFVSLLTDAKVTHLQGGSCAALPVSARASVTREYTESRPRRLIFKMNKIFCQLSQLLYPRVQKCLPLSSHIKGVHQCFSETQISATKFFFVRTLDL